jgi:HD-like signal output (HDOD) protein
MEHPPQPLTKAILQQFPPLANLQELHLTLLLDCGEQHRADAGSVLFDIGQADPLDYFLLGGKLELRAQDGKTHTIEAGTTAAHFPLSHLRPHHYRATAVTAVHYFTVEAAVLKELIETCSIAFGQVQDMGPSLARGHGLLSGDAERLLMAFQSDLSSGKLVLPAMPDVALRLREKLKDPQLDLAVAAKLISSEPAIAARLVQAANSPLYRRGTPCTSIQNAVMRLGMNTTRQLILGLLLRDMFTPQHIVLKKQWQRSWHQSVMVAATACVLARYAERFTAGEALLAGLVHLIGDIAVLTYVPNYPVLINSELYLQSTLDALRGIAGQLLLQSWHFPEPLVTVAAQSLQFERQHEGDADLCDLVILARHLALADRHALTNEHTLFPLPMAANYFAPLTINAALHQQISKESAELLADIGRFLF